MNSFTLKLIAIIAMLIDHIAAIFVSNDTILWLVMRSIGRLAFPIFVFLIVEGFHHTKDVKKYLIRLGTFALISEIPFDLAFFGKVLEFSHQNVFFTLFLGLSAITLMSMVEKKFQKQIFVSNLLEAVITIVFCALAILLKTDYHYAGILLIVAFYLFRGSKAIITLALLIVTITILGNINYLATLAIIPIAFYNGKKGKNIKYVFYIFYPAHLLILALLKMFLI
jgi:hypothetical protein